MAIEITVERESRPLLQAVWNGLRRRCPKCGEGKLFRAYLKVNDHCPVCGEELRHHRADDLPPYISIVIVGHILIGVMLEMEMTMRVEPYVYLMVMVPLALFLPLLMLPSIKGAVVGLQWANYMHGFDPSQRDPAAPDEI
ncbi:MAG: DUF983 domain-containing protein [Devosia sp.]